MGGRAGECESLAARTMAASFRACVRANERACVWTRGCVFDDEGAGKGEGDGAAGRDGGIGVAPPACALARMVPRRLARALFCVRGGCVRGGCVRGGCVRGGCVRGGCVRGGCVRGGCVSRRLCEQAAV